GTAVHRGLDGLRWGQPAASAHHHCSRDTSSGERKRFVRLCVAGREVGFQLLDIRSGLVRHWPKAVSGSGEVMQNQYRLYGFIAFLLFVSSLYAADATGSIGGTVLDPSGAPVARIRVVATNTAISLSRETLTAVDGGFVFPVLPVGPYTVTVEAAGFRRFEQ